MIAQNNCTLSRYTVPIPFILKPKLYIPHLILFFHRLFTLLTIPMKLLILLCSLHRSSIIDQSFSEFFGRSIFSTLSISHLCLTALSLPPAKSHQTRSGTGYLSLPKKQDDPSTDRAFSLPFLLSIK